MQNQTSIRLAPSGVLGKKTKAILSTGALILVVALCMIADMTSEYISRIIRTCCVYIISGLALNLIHGITGQFSLGQAGFMALGAYATAILTIPPETKEMLYYGTGINPLIGTLHMPFLPALIVGGLLAAAAGALIAIPIFRLRDDYLSIATMGFSEIIRIFINNMPTITNGPLGLKNVPPTANMWWTLGITAVVILFMIKLLKSSYGRAFRAVRDDEIAAEAMGVALFKHKFQSFVLSAFFAGVSGGLLASVVGTISPSYFKYTLSNEILLMVVLGGLGSITGTIVGATAITVAKEALRFLDEDIVIGSLTIPGISGMRMLFFSILLMVIILFRRQGIFGRNEFSWDAIYRFGLRMKAKLAAAFSPRKGGKEE